MKSGMKNLLMFDDEIIPPQQYLLQVILTDAPQPETNMGNYQFVTKDSVQVMLRSERFKHAIEIQQNVKEKHPIIGLL
ncbi:hypothetical protein DPMN_047538 [Dreissena polymorpha]|uniref:Uncharacterized protein n=1 Tax=Dreissena polymorpha TaxID=45954 RepID=A0A9D4D9Y7_DREPO|nr:hypothetical protein DPMN_047538 [Dreissena polymorpha]